MWRPATAFLKHPEFAAIAVDAVVAYSYMTDSAWVSARTLQEVQACTTDHDCCLSCIYPQPLLAENNNSSD